MELKECEVVVLLKEDDNTKEEKRQVIGIVGNCSELMLAINLLAYKKDIELKKGTEAKKLVLESKGVREINSKIKGLHLIKIEVGSVLSGGAYYA